ncbi:histidine phosphatase family protein [Sinimarinibacterium sp. CAU 1509]|uniref:histidine phosphatase family protein n=1 Tax=Sinimarinibacterium sp. CAU 1509 TaxID=2562283 RepID=UPI0010AC0377|nr:histidine phosphatase family protein [Sinimarinibacterium sp. CAU 1509]TJY62207.1 histidine phosphatase family protein [Sinimarinibacterium sp. CAU 1509]
MWSGRQGRFRLLAAFAVLAVALVCAAASAQADRIVFLVRHAEVASTGRDPALSPLGETRALALADILANEHPALIIVSNTQRSRQTAAALAARTGARVRVVDVDGSSVDAHVEAVVAAVLNYVGRGAVVVVGHSNTLPRVAAALGAPAQPDLARGCFDVLWRVSLRRAGALFEAFRYGRRLAECEPSSASAKSNPSK